MEFSIVVLCGFLLHFLAQPHGVLSEECSTPPTGTQKHIQYALTHVLLHQEYPRCSSVDFSYQRLICEIWDAFDEEAVLCEGQGECVNVYDQQLLSQCPDGILNKTCVPSGDSYECACYSNKKEPNCAHFYSWDDERRDIEGTRQQGLYQELCQPGTGLCIAAEFLFGVAYLVKYLHLPDAQISASSSGGALHEPYRVRIDNYMANACGWAAGTGNPSWVQFNLLDVYVGLGVLVRARCDPGIVQYPTKLRVDYSLEGTTWNSIQDLIEPVYHGSGPASYTSTNWFQQSVSGRYWRIYILESHGGHVMKGDIIGKVDQSSTTC